MAKILRIGLESGSYALEDVPEEYRGLGGRGLTSAIVSREVDPKADPLEKGNKLVLAAGILAATMAPNNGRLSVGAKSPLTGTIKEANSGGATAQKMARLGIQAVVLEGKAPDPTVIRINKDGAAFIAAPELKGMGNYDLVDALKAKYGDRCSFVTVGPAGEMGLKAASVISTTPDFHLRVAARGGLGSVMGSKNVKAIVFDDSGADKLEIADKEKMKEAAGALSKGILSHPLIEGFKQLGTPLLVNMINAAGCLPTKNYSQGTFDGAQAISGEHLVELLSSRPNAEPVHRCMTGCIVSCSNIFTDTEGKMVVSGIEYETLGLVGSNCMIDNIDTIAWINRICNDVGVDTMDIGAAIAVAMEAGILPWGDDKAALALVEEIGKGTEKGTMIGNGCAFTGAQLGVKRIPAVKGQSLAAYDPRVLKGTGTTYATCTMGADHTAGNALPSPANPDYNPAAPTGQAEISGFLQRFFAAIDSLGLCLFAAVPLLDIPELQAHLAACATAVTGEPAAEDYLLALGSRVIGMEREFNNLVGFTREDDRLPPFFVNEPLPPSGLVFDVSNDELDSVYGS